MREEVMAERSKQKLKLIYLMQILMEKTDETHSITMAEMITALKAYGITAERKSLYDDIECLRTYDWKLSERRKAELIVIR